MTDIYNPDWVPSLYLRKEKGGIDLLLCAAETINYNNDLVGRIENCTDTATECNTEDGVYNSFKEHNYAKNIVGVS